jgi:hypothetical protein
MNVQGCLERKGRLAAFCLGLLMTAWSVSSSVAAVTSTVAEDWGAEASPGVTVTEDGATGATVTFAPLSPSAIPGRLVSGTLQADLAVSGGAFTGNYLAGGVKGLSMRVARGGDPVARILLRLEGAGGRIWQTTNIVLTATADQWIINNIALDWEDGGWECAGRGDRDASWQEDIVDVKQLSVRIVQNGVTGQSCSVKDFRLVGDGFVSEAAVLAKIQEHFDADVSNVDELSDAERTQDSDKDGITDIEALADGEDPGLAVEILEVGGDGITVSWPCVAGRKYTLRRCSALAEGFDLVLVADREAATSGTMTHQDDTATGPGSYFYRVTKK